MSICAFIHTHAHKVRPTSSISYHACMYVCMYVHRCVYTYIHTYIHKVRMYVCMYVHSMHVCATHRCTTHSLSLLRKVGVRDLTKNKHKTLRVSTEREVSCFCIFKYLILLIMLRYKDVFCGVHMYAYFFCSTCM